jgi:hypothetical protein
VAKEASSPGPGMATDSKGNAVVDPTRNVLDLVEAAVKRQDDLREAESATIRRELEVRQETRQREHTTLQELVETMLHDSDRINAEKFTSVEKEFSLSERQRVEQKKDTKDAVDAALSAAKEAVKEQTTASERSIAKSETATSKQLEQLTATFQTAVGGIGTSINDLKDSNNITIGDLKDRVAKIETSVVALASKGAGAAETRTDNRAGSQLIVAVLGTFFLALSLGVGVAALFLGR